MTLASLASLVGKADAGISSLTLALALTLVLALNLILALTQVDKADAGISAARARTDYEAGTGVPRAELFLASKVWTTNIHAGESAVRAQVEKTLRELRTDYLDLYCVHWPVPGKHVAAYRALERLHVAALTP